MIRNNQIMKIYGTDYEKMTVRLLRSADLCGLISDRKKRIGIKPNLVVPSPAELGATTHPAIVAALISYLQEEGFENIVVAEGSWVGDRTSEAYEYCGYRDVCEKYGVPFIDTQKEKSHKVNCGGMTFAVTDVVERVDFWINVPVLKGHCQTKMTCALKNWKGLITNGEKRRFHTLGLHRPIAHLQLGIPQDFILVDHICGDLDFEEGGNPVVRNCIMAGLDPVLIDSYACYLLNYTPDDVPYVRLAEKLGVGSADLSRAEIISLTPDRERTDGGPEELPRRRRVLDVEYAVEEVDSCSACYGSLIGALCRLDEEGLLAQLDTPVGIGQGMRGRTGKLGIGRCTEAFDFCVMGCPPEEETIYRELKRYIQRK